MTGVFTCCLPSDKYQSSSTELLHRLYLLVLQLSVSKKAKQTELCCFSQKVILQMMGLTISVIMPLSTVLFNLNF